MAAVNLNGDATVGVRGIVATQDDTLRISIPGEQWATALWSILSVGTVAISTEVSRDGGVNWRPAAYSRRLDAASANPTQSGWTGNAASVVAEFETPIPGDCTDFRILVATTGTPAEIIVGACRRYVPGVRVDATVYDVTSGTNTALDTGVLDVGGWQTGRISFEPSGATATAVAALAVDAAGNTHAVPGTSSSITAALYVHYGFLYALTGGQVGVGYLPRRVKLTAAGVAAQTTRVALEVSR